MHWVPGLRGVNVLLSLGLSLPLGLLLYLSRGSFPGDPGALVMPCLVRHCVSSRGPVCTVAGVSAALQAQWLLILPSSLPRRCCSGCY